MMWPVYVEKLATQAMNNGIYSVQVFEMVKLQKKPAKLFTLKGKFS